MSFIGNASDIEEEKKLELDYHKKIASNLISEAMSSPKLSEARWNNKQRDDDTDSDTSESGHFLAKGAFLLTPSYELSMERAAMICEKMNFKGCFSLTKTATGILFKFSHPDDYQAVFKKGFHKVTGARFYRKVTIPCRPQKTFTLYVLDVPDDLPVEDVRHALYKFNSVVEVVRLVIHSMPSKPKEPDDGSSTPRPLESEPPLRPPSNKEVSPPLIRVTMASLDEFNILLQNGLNFYDATFFPTEANMPITAGKIVYKRRMLDGTIPGRVRELYPVFDAAGFCKIPAPASKTIKPIQMRQ